VEGEAANDSRSEAGNETEQKSRYHSHQQVLGGVAKLDRGALGR
jgi:hypothetical protein